MAEKNDADRMTDKTDETAVQGTEMDKNMTMDIAMDMGKLLLKSGAETSRVEETMLRFCRGCGYSDLNVVCMPTVIILGDESTEGKNRVFRVHRRFIDLGVIMAVNSLSYNFRRQKQDYNSIKSLLNGMAEKKPLYGRFSVCVAAGLGSAFFSMLLGGSMPDFAAAFLTCFAAMWLLKLMTASHLGNFWQNWLAGFVIGIIASVCCALNKGCTTQNVIVGALMPFLPGLSFTNGVRDYIAGDLLSGGSRIAEAVLMALSLAIGLIFALKLWRYAAIC